MKRRDLQRELLTDVSVVYKWLTLEHTKNAYTGGDEGAAERLLSGLEDDGWLACKKLLVSLPLPPVEVGPLFRWSPEEPNEFDAGRVSYLAIKRWKKTTLRTVRVWFAAKRARRAFGGAPLKGNAPGRMDQADHDTHLTSIALHVKRHRPEVFARIKGEDFIAKLYIGDKLPDFVVGPLLAPSLVIEGGGSYTKRMLDSFWRRWGPQSRTPTPHEIW